MKEMRYGVVSLSLFVAANVSAEQGVISLNWHQGTGGAGQKIEDAEAYGVNAEGSVATNWNNTSWAFANMEWDDGTPSDVGLSVSLPSGIINRGGAAFTNSPMEAGFARYPVSPAGQPNFTLSGLADSFEPGYKVIVYLTGANWSTSTGSISDGTTTYYFKKTATTNLVQATATDAGSAVAANYVVFENLSDPSPKFTLGPDGAGGGVAVGGFQIVGTKGTFEVPPPEGLVIGWDSGIGISYKQPDAKGNLWGGPWPANSFAGSLDGTFGTKPGATQLSTVSSVINNTNQAGNSDRMFPSVGWTSAVPVRVDSMHFDIGRNSNAFDTVTLYEIVGGATNLIHTETGLPITGSQGDYTDIDVLLTNISDNVLANGQTLNFMLVGANAVSNDANIFLDNTAFFGEPISHYEGWAYTYGDIGDEDSDADGDLLSNFGEYAFGGNPTNSNNVGYQPTVGALVESGSTNYIEYIHTERVTEGSSVEYEVMQRMDLMFGEWTNSVDAIEVGTGIVTSNQFHTVTNWIPTDGKTAEFLRVEASR